MNKPSKVNISVNPETMELLTRVRTELSASLGFTPSYSQVIQHLVNRQTDIVSECRQGESNE